MSYDQPPPDGPGPESSGSDTPPPPPPSYEPPPPSYEAPAAPPPPPPAPGYGTPPPPPPPPPAAPGYGTPPPPPQAYTAGSAAGDPSATDAIGYGWKKFSENAGPIIGAIALFLVIALVIEIVLYALAYAAFFSTDPGESAPGFFLSLVVYGVIFGVTFVVFGVVQAGVARASLAVTEGRPFLMKDVISTDRLGEVLIAALLVGVITGIGFVLCYFPGLIASFVFSYTMYFLVGKQMSPTDAIGASLRLTTSRVAPTLLYWIIAGIVIFIGAILCLVGLFVAIPVAIIGQAWMFKRLLDEPVAP